MSRPLLDYSDGKVCNECRLLLPLTEFGARRHRGGRPKACCRPCESIRTTRYLRKRRDEAPEAFAADAHSKHMWRRFGLSTEDYNRMLDEQGGVCAICFTPPTTKRLAVDHDRACCPGVHACGECIRGLLCNNCNSMLGFIRDDVDALQRAITYLQRSLP